MSLSSQDRAFVMGLKYEDMNFKLIESTFCSHFNPKTKQMESPRISFQEEFDLQPNEYLNKEKTHTNVGQMILNKCLYGNCPGIQKVLGYVAKPYTKSVIGETEDIIIKAMMNGAVSAEECMRYYDNIQWFN